MRRDARKREHVLIAGLLRRSIRETNGSAAKRTELNLRGLGSEKPLVVMGASYRRSQKREAFAVTLVKRLKRAAHAQRAMIFSTEFRRSAKF
jgi:hypothetical protein